MASDSVPSPSSFIETLITSRNREMSLFLPFILGLNALTQNPDSPRDRIILINPFTQNMVVVERDGSSSGFDSFFDGKSGPRPASRASIDALESVEIEEDGDQCAVCLEGWEIGGKAKEMPCKHRFCGGCIEKWLRVNGSCPVCRYEMPMEEGEDGDGGEGDGDGERRRGVWVRFVFSRDDSSERS